MSQLADIVKKFERDILKDWIEEQLKGLNSRPDLISESDLKKQSGDFLKLFQVVLQSDETDDISGNDWAEVRNMLETISKDRAVKGFSPSETATFIFSLKQPVFSRLSKALESKSESLLTEIWKTTVLLDKLGLYSTEAYIKSREAMIKRQQEEMLELSTPVVKIWDQIVAIPLIGTLDSGRTQVVMENLLQEIVSTSSSVAIIDITGVPTVDTLVAQHLLKTVSAARLMGADCVISGIRPQIAQTMVHLGVAFGDVITKSTLADAIKYALARTGCRIEKTDRGA